MKSSVQFHSMTHMLLASVPHHCCNRQAGRQAHGCLAATGITVASVESMQCAYSSSKLMIRIDHITAQHRSQQAANLVFKNIIIHQFVMEP